MSVAPDTSFEALTPTAFLARAALVHGMRTALVDGEQRFSYADLWDRSRRLAGGILDRGCGEGTRIATLCANSHLMLEAHHGVPLAGAVLVPLNHRLATAELARILDHAGVSMLLCDEGLRPAAERAVAAATTEIELVAEGEDGYEGLLAEVGPEALPGLEDERSLLSINYTSGTTGRPKGVMYHHRGAYLQALAMAFHGGLEPSSSFLWTLPMFHCHGWCFTWAVTAAGGTHVCMRSVDAGEVWRLIEAEGVTHLNASPTVLIALHQHADAGSDPDRTIRVAAGGAPPSPTLLDELAAVGFEVTHLYGLTETFGPIAICEWQPEWDRLPAERRAMLKARQGVANVIAQPIRVVDEQGDDVPADGETVGEVVLRGNDVMLGYYRDPEATATAMRGGAFHSGDLGVIHPDGYVELRDRAKDVIISGGENIASVEVEQALVSHPSVLDVAVVAVPDPRWGERPAAFVVLREGHEADPEVLSAHAREQLAGFKVPSRYEFRDELPKTATGKIEKHQLRDQAREGAA